VKFVEIGQTTPKHWASTGTWATSAPLCNVGISGGTLPRMPAGLRAPTRRVFPGNFASLPCGEPYTTDDHGRLRGTEIAQAIPSLHDHRHHDRPAIPRRDPGAGPARPWTSSPRPRSRRSADGSADQIIDLQTVSRTPRRAGISGGTTTHRHRARSRRRRCSVNVVRLATNDLTMRTRVLLWRVRALALSGMRTLAGGESAAATPTIQPTTAPVPIARHWTSSRMFRRMDTHPVEPPPHRDRVPRLRRSRTVPAVVGALAAPIPLPKFRIRQW